MTFRFFTALAATALLALAACGGGIEGTGAPVGTMRVSLTDAPSCGYDAVHVTVEKVRVHQSASALETDAGWAEVVVNPPKRIDLLTLTNGVLEELGQTALPAGKYTQLRLVLASNAGSSPPANAVTPTGGVETALMTPSGQQTGLKINVDLDVAADQVLDVVVDFDACKSIVAAGMSGNYLLKPVLSATPLLSDAGQRVVGYVDASIVTPQTNVSVQSGGVPVKATLPDASGRFVLYPVPVGTYDLVVAAPGRVTVVMTGVPVTSTAHTIVNTAAIPIAPAAAAVRAVTGTVTPSSATVRALQAFGSGPTVEVTGAVVNSGSGAFDFSLPIEAPMKTAYAANATTLNFIADAAAAGKYTLQAASVGVTQSQAIDASAEVPPVSFVFP
jgi:hypothetical protein